MLETFNCMYVIELGYTEFIVYCFAIHSALKRHLNRWCRVHGGYQAKTINIQKSLRKVITNRWNMDIGNLALINIVRGLETRACAHVIGTKFIVSELPQGYKLTDVSTSLSAGDGWITAILAFWIHSDPLLFVLVHCNLLNRVLRRSCNRLFPLWFCL